MSEHAESLLEQMLHEQKKQTYLLQQIVDNQVALIEAMGSDPDAGQDEEPLSYLDGAPCR